jgi:hypothetical protein
MSRGRAGFDSLVENIFCPALFLTPCMNLNEGDRCKDAFLSSRDVFLAMVDGCGGVVARHRVSPRLPRVMTFTFLDRLYGSFVPLFTMKLDARDLRYVSTDEFKVLSAVCLSEYCGVELMEQVETGSRNHEVIPTPLIAQISGLRGGNVNKALGELAKRNLVARVQNAKCTSTPQ